MLASHGAERTLPFRLPYGLLRTWNVIMATKFTRQALYDLLWSKPKTVVAAELGLSDVGLGKICREANIPIPPRGYWARITAGQKPARIPFPVRGLGQTDEVMIGREAWTGREERITELPPAPTFSESLAEVTQRAQKQLGKLAVAKTLTNPHPLIAKLLADDEQRRLALIDRPYAWRKPRFDEPLARRRLKIFNALFLMVNKAGFKPSLRGEEAEESSVHVGTINVSFKLTQIEQRSRAVKGKTTPQKPRLQLEISNWAKHSEFPPHLWCDTEETPLESYLPEIAVSLLVAGEMLYRGQAIWRHNHLVERKAEQDEKIRQAEEKAAREAEAALLADQQRRRDALLAAADNRQKAMILRALVAEAEQQPNVVAAAGFETWRTWVLGEAMRLDPFADGLEALLSIAPTTP